MSEPSIIQIDYDRARLTGTLTNTADPASSLWDRIHQSAAAKDDFSLRDNTITLPWPGVLSLIREFGPLQRKRRFRFRPSNNAKPEIDKFIAQYKNVKAAREIQPFALSEEAIHARLTEYGFTQRTLRPFQIRDLQRLVALQNGANFSVPGAGKTTVTFALHLLTSREDQKLVVVGPKSAFGAWSDVIGECISDDAPEWVREPFLIPSSS